jgi:RNA polymerase-binding transcription factor DksA
MTHDTSIKAQLETQLAQITADLKQIAQLDEKTGDWVAVPDTQSEHGADENEEADAVEEWNERRATLSALETTYRNVTRALQKITDGTYGICEISGGDIEPERLAVNPTARTCKAHMDEERTLSL